MLKQLSRLEKTRNTILLAFVVLMAVSLIFFRLGGPVENQDSLARSQETAATVGDETITVGDLAIGQQNRARQYAQYGMNSYTPPVKGILDGEISNRLIRLEAQRLGLAVSDQEVAADIRRQLKAANMNADDKEAYRRAVTETAGSVEKFEQSVRDQIAARKLEAYLTGGVQVSDEEILNDYKRRNSTFDVVYVPITAQQLATKLQLSDDELRNYFEQHKANYYISSPQKKIRYIFINQARVGEKISIPESDIRAEYDALPADKKQLGVQAQQIVLKVAKPEFEQNVLQKANELVAQARKDGDKVSEEVFANLARGNSEDPGTAANNGKLKGLVRPNPNNPTDPLQQVLNLEVGQITEPVKFGSAYYIFRRGESVPKTFEDAKAEILVSLRNRRAYKAAADLAQKAVDRLKETKNAQQVAQEIAVEANMKPAEMVRETAFIKPGDSVPDIGISPQFEEGIVGLENANDVGERTPIKDGFAIPLLVEKRDPRDAEFDEVKAQVAEAAKLEQAKARLEQMAKEVAAGANSPDGLKAAAAKFGLEAKDSKNYKIGSPLGEGTVTGSSPALEDAIFDLATGQITKNPIKVDDNYFVVGVTNRTDANLDEFSKERDSLLQQAASSKKNQIFADYLTNVRQKMEKEGRLKIYQDAVAKLETNKPAEES
jgi:peptidyl-prolyl cis-trans isomerase D